MMGSAVPSSAMPLEEQLIEVADRLRNEGWTVKQILTAFYRRRVPAGPAGPAPADCPACRPARLANQDLPEELRAVVLAQIHAHHSGGRP